MKNRWIVAACAAVCWTASAQTTAPYAPAPENLQARTAFQDAKFGIFLHWGLYSMLGSGEWTMTNRDINYREYAKLVRAIVRERGVGAVDLLEAILVPVAEIGRAHV